VEQYVIRGGQAGVDRLAVLARVWQPLTASFLDRAGVGPGLHCLDLGCGGGDVTLDLARRVGPTGSVTGVDMDPVKLDLAREKAEREGLRNVEFRAMNVYDWAEPDGYDLVFSRLLLQHLSRPLDVLRAMWEAVREGGVLAVEDGDFDGQFCYPPHAGFEFWVTAYPTVLTRHGGDPLTGRKLYDYFTRTGIPAPQLEVVQRIETEGEGRSLPLLTIEATASAIIDEGVATAAQVEVALGQLRELVDDTSTIIALPRHFQAWSRR
jgi:ubiquinone/menaquinone biosynthesis C-methylase UbiE